MFLLAALQIVRNAVMNDLPAMPEAILVCIAGFLRQGNSPSLESTLDRSADNAIVAVCIVRLPRAPSGFDDAASSQLAAFAFVARLRSEVESYCRLALNAPAIPLLSITPPASSWFGP